MSEVTLYISLSLPPPPTRPHPTRAIRGRTYGTRGSASREMERERERAREKASERERE